MLCGRAQSLSILFPLAASTYHLRAELVQALAGVITGLGVGRVAVQRVAVVGHLERPVAALGGPELGRVHAGPALGLPEVVSGGQRLAHAPLQVLCGPLSASNR